MLLKNIKFLTLLTLASFFNACSAGDEPENLIPEDKMVDLLTETHIIESQVGRMSLVGYDSANVAFQYLQEELWLKYQVDSAQYNESFEYYAKYPEVFEKIYGRIESRIKDLVDKNKVPVKENTKP